MNEVEQDQTGETVEELADPYANTPITEPAKEPLTRQTSVARSAGIVSIAVMFSRVLGLIRETIFARFFGAGFLYDAFLVGFRIPNLLRDLFAEGALSAAFVKVFTDYQLRNSEKEAWRLASLVFNCLAVVLSVICVAGILLSPLFVSLITHNYLGDPNHYYPPEKAALAVTLMQIMFPFILLVALAALAMGVLNTKGRFGIPASASTAFNIASIIFGLGLAFWLSGGEWERSTDKIAIPSDAAQWAIIGMSIGTLIGGAAQLLVQLPSLHKVGFRFSLAFNLRDEGVRKIMRLMGPAIIGTGAVQVKVLVDTIVSSGIEGGASWLTYAFRLMQFPIGVFGVAIGTAAIPTLSRLATEGNIVKFRETLADAMKLVFLLSIPSACGLIVLGDPIIALIYQRGEFDAFDTNMTAWALTAYSVGLAGYAAIKVLSPAFYALDDAKTPMYISVASIAIHFVTSFGMMQLLSTYGVSPERPNGFGHVGVALATSIVAIVNFVVLAFFMRRRIGRINGREILASLVKITIAAAFMSIVAYGSYYFLTRYFVADKHLSIRLIEAFLPISLAGVTFLIAARLLKIRELSDAIATIRRKLSR
ncbi:MAG: murein biosynthesis integral membrane protein MurJ [Pyrinomonadaceae bacterium]|nr:murein biosynthesis integral membrane protein MurJ [Pyrinomonadaceae bacterium]MBP6213900.1 murein biosynthesis integral membrane protein MurJ [Pyrinomonadaceae bacterium]